MGSFGNLWGQNPFLPDHMDPWIYISEYGDYCDPQSSRAKVIVGSSGTPGCGYIIVMMFKTCIKPNYTTTCNSPGLPIFTKT